MDARAQRLERAFEWPLTIAALLVVPVLVIQDGDYGEPWETIGTVLDWSIWLAFLIEVVVMLAVVSNRKAWARDHPLDLPIVVLTPPFLAGLAHVRLLRLLRLLRLFRLAPLLRRVTSAEGLRYAGVLAAITAVTGGAAFASVEKGHSTAEGVYWAVTTRTTVGYGDLSPETTTGRVVAVIVMLVGIGFVAVLTGAIAQRFLAPDVEEVEQEEDRAVLELRAIAERLDRLEAAVRGPG